MPHVSTRLTLLALLGGLQDALQSLFAQRLKAEGRRRRALQRRALFGLELLWKIEEQVVLPAVHERHADDAAMAPRVQALLHEIELMRDLAALSVQTASGNRDMSIGVLEGMASLHFERLQHLLASVDEAGKAVAAVGPSLDWAALEAEVQGLLGRWRSEIAHDGHLEDEEADPVGAAPR